MSARLLALWARSWRQRASRPTTSGPSPSAASPTEVETLLGDPSKARDKLGWTPRITLAELVAEMVAHDLDKARRHALLKSHGFDVAISLE